MKKKKLLGSFIILFLGISIVLTTYLIQHKESFEIRQKAAGYEFPTMSIRAINYMPGEHTWQRMWLNWDFSAIQSDMLEISKLNANAIRIGSSNDVLGNSFPSTSKAKVDQILQEADKYGIKIIFNIGLSGGDYPCGSSLSSNHQAFLQNFIGTYKDDTRILMWELLNEPHCGDNWGNLPADARGRLRTGLEFIKSIDSNHPVSVPLFQDTIDDVSDIVDVFDVFNFHLYTYSDPSSRFTQAQTYANGKPIFVGEFGCVAVQYHADWGNDLGWYCLNDSNASTSQQQTAQANLYERYYNEASARGFAGFAPWIFSEFAQPEPGTGAQNTPTESDRYFGIVKLDHSWTPAATRLSQLYDRCGNGNVDSGEDCDGSNLAGQSCTNLGYDSGTLSCTSDCRFDTSGCISTPPPPPPSSCGDGNIDSGEDCDGSNFAGRNCLTYGYSSGNLSCTSDCKINTSSCSSPVDCMSSGDCYGFQVCDLGTHKCSCPSNFCTLPKVVNSTCDKCVCPTSCRKNQIQRGDCSCLDITSTPSSEKELILNIIRPEDDEIFDKGEKIIFEAEAFYNNGEDLDEEKLVWSSDKYGEIGKGMTTSSTSLDIGTHTLTLSFEGDDVSKSINIHVLSDEEITIYDEKPREGQEINKKEVVISGVISSPKAKLDTTKTKFSLNGEEITTKTLIGESYVEYTTNSDEILEGKNIVNLTVANFQDQTAQKTWEFTYSEREDIAEGTGDEGGISEELKKMISFITIVVGGIALGTVLVILTVKSIRKKKGFDSTTSVFPPSSQG